MVGTGGWEERVGVGCEVMGVLERLVVVVVVDVDEAVEECCEEGMV